MKKALNVTEKEIETAVLIGVINKQQNEALSFEYLHELAFLAETYGVVTKKTFTQKLEKADKATFIGKGKLADVKAYIVENKISVVIFDDELSPSQQRNLETELGVKIIDRTNLILEIFSQRAQTAHARTQVELARQKYLLPPRKTARWNRYAWWCGGKRN